MSQTPTTVLVAPAVPAQLLEGLRERHQDVRFVALGDDGAAPVDVATAHAVLRVGLNKPQLSELLQRFPDVTWVHTSTAGFDWALVPEIPERGIALTRSAAAYAVPIGEFTVALIASLVKRLPVLEAAQRERRWASVEPLDLAGLRVGIVGAGGIGHEVAWRAAALGMRVTGLQRSPRPQPHYEAVMGPDRLHELLAGSDVVVIACPLTPETRGLIGAAELAAMPAGSYLINVARGPIVVSEALVAALRSGHLAGAALDALDVEPLPEGDPLWDVPNLTITPHTSFKSPRNLERVLAEFEANLGRFLRGEPLANTMRHPELGY